MKKLFSLISLIWLAFQSPLLAKIKPVPQLKVTKYKQKSVFSQRLKGSWQFDKAMMKVISSKILAVKFESLKINVNPKVLEKISAKDRLRFKNKEIALAGEITLSGELDSFYIITLRGGESQLGLFLGDYYHKKNYVEFGFARIMLVPNKNPQYDLLFLSDTTSIGNMLVYRRKKK